MVIIVSCCLSVGWRWLFLGEAVVCRRKKVELMALKVHCISSRLFIVIITSSSSPSSWCWRANCLNSDSYKKWPQASMDYFPVGGLMSDVNGINYHTHTGGGVVGSGSIEKSGNCQLLHSIAPAVLTEGGCWDWNQRGSINCVLIVPSKEKLMAGGWLSSGGGKTGI